MTESSALVGPNAAGSVLLLAPKSIIPNPENPRLIFHADELEELEKSIADQGILVPLTVYKSRADYVILDGERRWRCSLKLKLPRVPVIVQPEPTRFQNIMMMFAIHNARKDWDPLPTAYKLRDLEDEFERREERKPNELELAQLASMTRGEVRRLRQLLELPPKYREDLMDELEKPRSEQVLTVDLVLETTRGVDALAKRDIIAEADVDPLRQAIIQKYRDKVIKNTVEPRQLARIARGVERNEIAIGTARHVTQRLIADPSFGIQSAFKAAAEQVDLSHTLEQLAERTERRLVEFRREGYRITDSLKAALEGLAREIRASLRAGD
jgi:ParB family chromosome partitioning protein